MNINHVIQQLSSCRTSLQNDRSRDIKIASAPVEKSYLKLSPVQSYISHIFKGRRLNNRRKHGDFPLQRLCFYMLSVNPESLSHDASCSVQQHVMLQLDSISKSYLHYKRRRRGAAAIVPSLCLCIFTSHITEWIKHPRCIMDSLKRLQRARGGCENSCFIIRT